MVSLKNPKNKKGEIMEEKEKIKETEKTLQAAASFILSLNEEFFLEEIEMITLLIGEMKKALQTNNVENVNKIMRNISIIGQNRDWGMIEAYEMC